MKVGIFSPYWQTFGGGERYVLTAAEFFLKRGDQVDIFWRGDSDTSKIKKRFDLDLSGANFIPDIFLSSTSLLKKITITTKYDLIFFLSDGSIPTLFAQKNILHFQVPFHYPNQNNFLNKLKLLNISKIICNSFFTKKYIDETYNVQSDVIYPPVDVDKFFPEKKENIILSVGRFFGPSNPKKHEVLIDTFRKMVLNGLSSWKLILIGGITRGSEEKVATLKLRSKGLQVEFFTDSSFKTLQDNYAKAKVYWHATGFGEDLKRFPEKAEHFGITTVEAMAAGAVPIVFAGGGQLEIVRDGESGLLWKSTRELQRKTLKLITDRNLQSQIASQAMIRSKKFSKQRFFEKLAALV